MSKTLSFYVHSTLVQLNICLKTLSHSRLPVSVPVPLCHRPEHVPEFLHLRGELADLVLLKDGEGEVLPGGEDVGEAPVGHL